MLNYNICVIKIKTKIEYGNRMIPLQTVRFPTVWKLFLSIA